MDDLETINKLDAWGLTNFAEIAELREKIRSGGLAALSSDEHTLLVGVLDTIPYLREPIAPERRVLNVGNYVRFGGEIRAAGTE